MYRRGKEWLRIVSLQVLMSSIEASKNGNLQGLYDDVSSMLETSLKKLKGLTLRDKQEIIDVLKASDEEIKTKYKQLKRKKK